MKFHWKGFGDDIDSKTSKDEELINLEKNVQETSSWYDMEIKEEKITNE